MWLKVLKVRIKGEKWVILFLIITTYNEIETHNFDLEADCLDVYFTGTVFAYGQTSSGKTFTMNGSAANPGVISLGVKDIFDAIQMVRTNCTVMKFAVCLQVTRIMIFGISCWQMSNREFLVRVSYMEIYNEEINDLLAVENQKLQIHESLEVWYWWSCENFDSCWICITTDFYFYIFFPSMGYLLQVWGRKLSIVLSKCLSSLSREKVEYYVNDSLMLLMLLVYAPFVY